MTRKSGICTWPPSWTTIHRDRNDKPRGEIGVLTQVVMNDLLQPNTKVFIFIEYNGFRYMGLLSFDDAQFCRAIYTLLRSNIGRSISEIGDLDVSFTL
jgi:hypothetical protein